ncbi:interleukin-1 receptor-associated kinase 1-binding protein 1 isoform X1 [Taeniopygia guttata]|uniref:interleukin-1 receptor-associated kinase 1-binding protein 1 isoform X1 n=1 Tax=Taeniopygia guttata TaxID=59729 RepID=UPI003BB8A7B8
MAPPAPPPSRVFAELDLAPSPAPEGRVEPPALPGREVHVSGSAELSARPDRARVSLRLGSRKEAAAAARSSVSRRLQYIAHSARLHGVPEENMTVTEDFSRVENTFQMEAEVCMIFSDFGKMQNVCNLLIEKLGTSVTINPPHFYHTPEAIDTLRTPSCSEQTMAEISLVQTVTPYLVFESHSFKQSAHASRLKCSQSTQVYCSIHPLSVLQEQLLQLLLSPGVGYSARKQKQFTVVSKLLLDPAVLIYAIRKIIWVTVIYTAHVHMGR